MNSNAKLHSLYESKFKELTPLNIPVQTEPLITVESEPLIPAKCATC